MPGRHGPPSSPGSTDDVADVRVGRARREREHDLQRHLGTARPSTATWSARPSWTNRDRRGASRETTTEKVRNVNPIKINEFRDRHQRNPTNSFIELYNAGDSTVDVSGWTLTEHPTQQAVYSTVTDPGRHHGSPRHGHYLLGLSTSGLAAPASAGDTTLNVSSTDRPERRRAGRRSTPAPPPRSATIADITGRRRDRAAGRRARSATRSSSAANNEYVNLPTGIVSGLSDFTISAWVNPAANDDLVAGLRLRHRHHGEHVPDRQRRRRGAALRHHHRRQRRRAAARPAAASCR